jgi:nitronate monooxygenase
MTSPIRKASVELEDPHGTNLWAGTAYRKARSAPAEDIVKTLGHI